MAKSQFMSGVLRISDVAIAKSALESALQTKLDKFEPTGSVSMHYAQLDVPAEEGGWSAIVGWMQIIGPRISALRQRRLIGLASIDLAIAFDDDKVSLSIDMPSHAAEMIGKHGIDIEFSVYLTNEKVQ